MAAHKPHRPHLQGAAFAMEVVQESKAQVFIPSELNEQEHAAFLEYHAHRRAKEWRPPELKLLGELARLSVKIEQLSLQLSVTNFEDAALLTQYERLCKLRDQLRKPLNLHTIGNVARTMASQKLAADQIIDGLTGASNATVQKPAKFDWDKILHA